ncbi:sterol 3-beta-glucosyltransferase UGT80A2 isoform X1 [Arachis hypogaea]|uniref:sterol 3-beta-glucosyltransferase UGT80A2 isoform X1 n=1 Tax=Arachis hypogaea TaxID=3818 RepID=UPI000DED015B|nr:sterol 3-beta-glucosyltransferase UGT80A2 isoform X1 [Arachis hypogaea]XP_025688494.1 sterol 3-beta-glucosyltransferase UGT80A2 isoform X1 [Arachis hypogaea]XP_025688495.1 sterol 3-beta-glucosyltransferase UGT80A2 isoform X1 [Arachis hypogaea]XP_025688496.1 sterol 3-beta-glucosyltransferase UGT80A2 isoform X1 [Arachis hypogaea]XP_025688497.1 sterol 3-beta-glucosyltransferase UGT80A2 isoform X1 [Arachis hypogaea]XP_025688498.1 sterol 3-beta-glucosyltransferase UGT80A2 isoform X1 [Arachis hyp
MVKNKGFLPSGRSEIHKQRNQIKAIINSLLPACNSVDPDTHVVFNADAIIANPPAYWHTHVTKFLKVPLHIFFTMPWTPTYEFPHPLSRIKQQMAYKVHHGGAGTTAASLRAACPTTIVPFFGDQPFWGERVHARGVGRALIPLDEFTLGRLVGAINYMLKPEIIYIYMRSKW